MGVYPPRQLNHSYRAEATGSEAIYPNRERQPHRLRPFARHEDQHNDQCREQRVDAGRNTRQPRRDWRRGCGHADRSARDLSAVRPKGHHRTNREADDAYRKKVR